MKFKIADKISKLETIEQKSFWTAGIGAVILGLVLNVLAFTVYDTFTAYIGGAVCVIVPVLIMWSCYVSKNYHLAYPILCIVLGAIVIPFLFFSNGGFFSGMPLFCVIGSALCSFCYEKHWRYISFVSTFVANAISFTLVHKFGTMNPIESTVAIEWDIVESYYFASLGIFAVINLVINEVRNYATLDEALKPYFDKNTRNRIIEQAHKPIDNLKGESKQAVVLFADISHFTTTTERMGPEMTAEFLNVFLGLAEQCIHKNNGVLDKYIGDCAMAYWVDDTRTGNVIMDAIKTIEDLKVAIYERAEDTFDKFGTELNFSAGLDYGEVVCGNIGSEGRREYTIIGDTVNTASRIEGLAAGGELLISDRAAMIVKDAVDLVISEMDIPLKGKRQAINIYSVEGIKDEGSLPIVTAPDSDIETGYHFYVCGCRGSFPVSGIRFSEFGGDTSCYVLKKNHYAVVIDCGSGLVNAAPVLKDCAQVDILLTHVHYDHIIGLLKPVLPKYAKIRILGHFSGWVGSKTLDYFLDAPFWPVKLPEYEQVDVALGKEFRLQVDIRATFFRSAHPNNGCVLRLMAGDKKICILSDCENAEYLDSDIAEGADLLLYDGTFDRTDKDDHKGFGHSTWQDGVDYAKRVNAKKLVITHHSPDKADHTLMKLEAEAKHHLPTACFARAGDHYIV